MTAVQRVSTQLPRHRRLSRTGFLSTTTTTTTTTILVLRPVPENRSKNQETVSRKNKQRHPPAPPTQRLPLGPGWQPTTTIYRRDWLARILPIQRAARCPQSIGPRARHLSHLSRLREQEVPFSLLFPPSTSRSPSLSLSRRERHSWLAASWKLLSAFLA